MNLYLLTPTIQQLNDDILDTLKSKFEVVNIFESIEQIENIKFTNQDIIALDPDFVNWNFKENIILEKFKYIHSLHIASTGYDWIDLEFFKLLNIPVTNIIGFSGEAVAEWAIMCMFILARKLPLLQKDNYPKLEFIKYQGIQLKNKSVGIIGLGNIGRLIAEKCRGLSMNVSYWNRSKKDFDYRHYTNLRKLIEDNDFIFITLTTNSETTKLFTEEIIDKLQRKYLINVSHSGLYDHKKLLEMTSIGKVFGYAYESTTIELDLKIPGNILSLPKYAWDTDQTFMNVGMLWSKNILDSLVGVYKYRV